MAKSFIICFFIVSVVFSSCNNVEKKKTDTYNLKCSYHSKLYDDPINLKVVDSVDVIDLFFEFKRNTKDVKRQLTFKFFKDAYYELKLNKHFDDEKIDSIYAFSLAFKDTSYEYIFNNEKYPANMPKGYDDWRYTITKRNDETFSLTKNHLRDSTFKEEFLYDKNYKIIGVNIYQATDTLIFTNK